MSAKETSSSEYSNNLLKLVFNGTNFANLADNAATSPFTNLYVSLHTSSPGASGTQSTSETTYPSYTRIGISRDTGGWAVTNNAVSPVSEITFPSCTGSTSDVIGYFAIGTGSSGAGHLLYYGQLKISGSPATITMAPGVQPILETDLTVTET